MTSEFDMFKSPKEQVLYEKSIVIEAMAILFHLHKDDNQSVFDLPELKKRYQDHPVVKVLPHFPEQSYLSWLNLILPIPFLHDINDFSKKLKQMKLEYFLYYIWSEMIDLETIKGLLKNPASIWQIEDTFYWQTDEQRAFNEQFVQNIESFQEQLASILVEIAMDATVQKSLSMKVEKIEEKLQAVQNLKLEPLQRAQYVMGKAFRRVSDYKIYTFISSYYLSPTHIRIFDDSVCYVIFGSTTPLTDKREEGEVLAKQLKVLADPTRLRLLAMIAGQKEYGARLAEFLGITTATVSHHLELLKKAGLVHEEKIGTIKYFTTNKDEVNELVQSLQSFLNV